MRSADPRPGLLARAASRFPQLTLWTTLALGTAAIATTSGFAATHALMLNASPSLPYWAIWLKRDAVPARGDLMVFVPPPSPLLAAHFGANPKPFAKRVLGVGGDRVTLVGRTFAINGKPVATAKVHSRIGEPLALGPTGTIPQGCFFVATSNPDSFDSRYAAIGWICAPRVLGVGSAVL